MITKSETKNRVKYLGKEYLVDLHKGDFELALKTFRYCLGEMNDTENALIEPNENDLKNIFKENGHRVIHFYSDNKGVTEEAIFERKEFIDTMIDKYSINNFLVFLRAHENASMSQISDMLDVFGHYDNIECYISLVSDTSVEENSIRIVASL